MSEDYPRTLLELEKRFCSEESCIAYLVALRWPGGWSCPRCSATEGWTVRRNRWLCGHCRYEMSITAGTVFQDSHLSLMIWSRAIWQLWGEIEVDETWVGGAQAGLRGSRQLKGGKAALVLVAVERRGRGTGRIRMAVIPDFKRATLIGFLQQNVALGSTVYTDGLKSFTGFEEVGLKHVPRNQPLQTDLRKGAKSAVPLADRAIGNLQQWLIGTYHGVSRDQLQFYLDEFVFRHNRRGQPMAAFQTLLGLGAGRALTPYDRIRGAKDMPRLTAEGHSYR